MNIQDYRKYVKKESSRKKTKDHEEAGISLRDNLDNPRGLHCNTIS